MYKSMFCSAVILAASVFTMSCATKTPYEATTANLQPGGDYYFYKSGTLIAEQIDAIPPVFDAIAELCGPSGKNIRKISSGILPVILNDTGIREIQGFGKSSIQNTGGLYSDRTVFYCPDARKKGFVWNMAGKENHEFDVLKMIPASAAMFMTADWDFAGTYSFIKKSLEKNGEKEALSKLLSLEKMALASGVDIVKLLNSLDGNITIVFDENKSGASFLPFALTYMIKTKDDAVFKLAAAELQKKGIPAVDGKISFPVPFRVELMQKNGYLVFRLGDSADPFEVLAGKVPNITADPDFIRYSEGVGLKGVNCVYNSPRYLKIMKAFIEKGGNSVPLEELDKLFVQVLTVTSSTNDGYVVSSNSSKPLVPNYIAMIPYILKTVKSSVDRMKMKFPAPIPAEKGKSMKAVPSAGAPSGT